MRHAIFTSCLLIALSACQADAPQFPTPDDSTHDIGAFDGARDGGDIGRFDIPEVIEDATDVEAGLGDAVGDADAPPTDASDRGAGDVVDEALPVDPAPARDCRTEVVYDPFFGSASSVSFASEANGWDPDAGQLEMGDDGLYRARLDLPAGNHGYKLVRDGEWILDPANPYLIEVDAIQNSLVQVPPCEGPLLSIGDIDSDWASGTVTWTLDVHDTPDAPGIDLDSLALTVNRVAVSPSAIRAAPSRVIHPARHHRERRGSGL